VIYFWLRPLKTWKLIALLPLRNSLASRKVVVEERRGDSFPCVLHSLQRCTTIHHPSMPYNRPLICIHRYKSAIFPTKPLYNSLSQFKKQQQRLFRTFISYHTHLPFPRTTSSLSSSSILKPDQAKSNPNPFIQLRYLVTISAHAACGSLAVENSMHSSRAAFSSLHTQQGLTLGAPSSPGGLFEEARLLIWEGALAECC
jgi:hypothetical protein